MAYIATISILIDVETDAEACDAIANSLHPLMRPFNPVSCLRDWRWEMACEWPSLDPCNPIPADFRMDDPWPFR